jgi:hypothetical protein
MPVLIDSIPEDLDKLLENRGLAAITLLRKLCGIVVMAIDATLVLVVRVLGAKYCWAYAAGEVLDVVFPIQRCDVRASQCASASKAEQVEPSEVVCLTQRVLIGRLIGYWEEFGCHDFVAVLQMSVQISGVGD